jgi:hypothetical protein
MKAYQTSAKDPNIIAIDLSGKHSWDEVLRVAKDAEAEYRRSGRKVLRYVARTFTSKSVVVLPYLKLIPNGFFSSMLAGALKLVFTVSLSHRLDFEAPKLTPWSRLLPALARHTTRS